MPSASERVKRCLVLVVIRLEPSHRQANLAAGTFWGALITTTAPLWLPRLQALIETVAL